MTAEAERPFDRAARDTRTALSSLRYQLLTALVAGVVWLVPGSSALVGAIAAVLVLAAIYGWNLLRAPYRLLDEHRERELCRALDPGLDVRVVVTGPVVEVRAENVGTSVRVCSVLVEDLVGIANARGLIETPYYVPWLTGQESLGDYSARREGRLRPGEIARFWLMSWLYPRQEPAPHNLFYVFQCAEHQFPLASEDDEAPRFTFQIRVLSDRDQAISRRIELIGDTSKGQLQVAAGVDAPDHRSGQ